MPLGHMVCHLPSLTSISAGVSSHLYAANGNYAASIKSALSGDGGWPVVQKDSTLHSLKMSSRLFSNEGRGLGGDDISAVTNL